MNLRVKIKRLHPDAIIPQYAREGDAGFDLVATSDVIIEPGETKIVPTGIAISLPPGYEAQIRPRSGITVKTKLRVALGTIDQGYVGEIGVIVDNVAEYGVNDPVWLAKGIDNKRVRIDVHTDGEMVQHGTYIIRKGDRIAQAVIAPVAHATFTEVDELGETERGSGSFGSTGIQ